MKKIILVFLAVAIAAGAYAQVDSSNRKMSPRDINDGMHQNRNMKNNPTQNVQNNSPYESQGDGLVMRNGKIMQVRNGQATPLDSNMTLSNGTKIMTDGTCIKKDGSKVMLKEGQHLDMSGNMAPKANEDKNMYLVPDSTRKK